jgi:sugar phosphate isomerase/epimerase
MDHAMLRRTLDRLGLKAPSIHVPYDLMTKDFGAVTRMARTLGAETIIFPWLSPEFRTEQGFEPVIPDIARFARQAHEAGFGFAYHNHDFEFLARTANRSMSG